MIWSHCCNASRITYCNSRISAKLALFQGINKAGQVRRQGAFEGQPGPGPGVAEAESGGVQGLAAEAGKGRLARRAEAGQALRALAAIERVAQQGVADGGQVDPDLVGPARGQPALDEGRPETQRLEDPIAGQR